MTFLDKIINSKWKSDDFPKYPRITRKEFNSWNEKMFKKFNNERIYSHPNPIIRFVERKRVNKVLKNLNPLEDAHNILAAGSGEGYIEKQIIKGNLFLVDLSKEAIRRARKNLKNNSRAKFFVANLEKLPFKQSYFDKIECSEVIEHVFSPEKILSEFFRVLKEEGSLIVSFPNESLINFLKKVLINLRIFNIFFPNIPNDMTEEWHLHAFDISRFKKVANGSWEIISIDAVPFMFLPLRYIVKCKKIPK